MQAHTSVMPLCVTKHWNRIYVEICGLLFADHRDAFMGIMNGDIPGGYSALAFADERNYRRMRVPKSFAPGYYLESNLDATSIVRKLRGLHQLFNVGDDLQITYQTVDGYQPTQPKEHREIEASGQTAVDNDYNWHRPGLLLVDLTREDSYAFTQPEAYEYNGATRRVNKWGKLYADLCGLLFADYHDAFMEIMNGDIPGYNALAFADEQHKSGMRVARQFSPGYYLESNIDATTIVRRIRGLSKLFNLGNSLRISYTKTGSSSQQETPDDSGEEWIIHELRTRNIRYVDNRSVDGCLWIASDMSIPIPLNEAADRGYHLRLKQDGCRAFPNQPVLWIKDQPEAPSKSKPAHPADGDSTSLYAFKRYLHEEKGFAERTAGNYWTSIRMIETYIQRNHLGFSLMNTDAGGAQRIFDLLMARPDFEQINIQRHRQFSAALVQYVAFLRQGGAIVSGGTDTGEYKQPGQKTITETVFDVLRHAGKPLTVSEIYQAIVRDSLYPFGAQDPQSVVYSKVSLACRQTEIRISEGQDVLIKTEEDGRKKYQVMTAGEAAVYLKRQQTQSELATAAPWAEYEAVLKQAFQKGFQKESGLDMKKLRKRWEEIHGEELKDSDEVVRLQLAGHCVDTGKRWYLAELLLTEDDRRIVLEYIDRTLTSGKQVLYYSSIYAALEHELESTILTEDLLVSYLQATCQDRYILREHYLTNDHRAKVDLAEEIKDVIKMTKQHKKDAICYLTDNTKLEKEAIIDLLSLYAAEYTHQELVSILAIVYPDLAVYLNAYSFPGNTWLDAYFMEYRYSKVLNHISPELMTMAQQQAIDHDFLKLLPRIAVVDGISKAGSFLYFVDALGVEFIPFIVQKCREYDLRLSVSVAHSELPSLTRCNKDFFESYPPEQRTKVSELDDIIHHGKENYDYQVTKTPLHLIRELEIIDEVLRNARTRLMSGNITRVLLVADHGATRMAVINEHIIDIDVNSKGTNGGRVCEYTEAVKAIPSAIHEGDYYILASYDRFKGGQPANVEAHGGGTLEEVVVPIIMLTMPTEEIEVQVESKVVEYSFKQAPVLRLFSKTVLSDVSVLINGKWYKAEESLDGQNFSFTLTGLKKGPYTAALYSEGSEVANGLTFELRSKAGSSTGKAGIL